MPSRSAVDPAVASIGFYEATPAETIARMLSVPRVLAYDEVASTLDVAHALAADGALPGTLILADAQSAGRGRLGRTWTSERGAGLWFTVVERPRDTDALDVLSLRIGIAVAPALDAFADRTVRLKWPNDLYLGTGKLGGILVEARWRDARAEWVAIGIGINVHAPAREPRAAGLGAGTSRLALLGAILPAVRRAAARRGALDDAELRAFADRDMARGRACVAPGCGMVQGIDSHGGLLVDMGGEVVALRAGSLVLEEES